jgi:hypothetical protein
MTQRHHATPPNTPKVVYCSTVVVFQWIPIHTAKKVSQWVWVPHQVELGGASGFGWHACWKMVTEVWFKKRPKL